jgi:hypothetical protein
LRKIQTNPSCFPASPFLDPSFFQAIDRQYILTTLHRNYNTANTQNVHLLFVFIFSKMIALHLRLRFPAAALWLAVFATSKTTRTNGLKFDEPAVSPVEMVVSANNLATDAGKAVLARGGSAVDAMIAVQVRSRG